jgi:hypothetical protein
MNSHTLVGYDDDEAIYYLLNVIARTLGDCFLGLAVRA